MTRVLRVNAKQVEVEGKKFIACTTKIGNKYYKIKFRQECENAPKKSGVYEVHIELKFCNIQRGKLYTGKDGNEKRGNDIIWVSEISRIRKYTDEEIQAENEAKMLEVFGENTDEDLPF